jgi:hypothetical protein
VKNAEWAGFMQNMFRASQLSSKETVTEAEMAFCPAAMVGAATFSREAFSKPSRGTSYPERLDGTRLAGNRGTN